jgi:hypothetical protein
MSTLIPVTKEGRRHAVIGFSTAGQQPIVYFEVALKR